MLLRPNCQIAWSTSGRCGPVSDGEAWAAKPNGASRVA